MRKVKVLAVFMAIIVLSMTTINAVTTFSDVTGTEWYSDHVSTLVDEGIIGGYPDGTFGPSKTMTADAFIKTMVVALGHDVGNGSEYWASEYIAKARELGLIDDYEYKTKVASQGEITRAQMSKICERTVESLDGTQTYSKTQSIKDNLEDYSAVNNSGFDTAIYHMYELGIITGYTDGTFKPSNTLTRAEAATVIRRVIDESIRKPFEEPILRDLLNNLDGSQEGKLSFSIYIDLRYDLESQYEAAENFLVNDAKVDLDTVQQIMSKVKTKTKMLDVIESTYFPWREGEQIQLLSSKTNAIITIRSANEWSYVKFSDNLNGVIFCSLV